MVERLEKEELAEEEARFEEVRFEEVQQAAEEARFEIERMEKRRIADEVEVRLLTERLVVEEEEARIFAERLEQERLPNEDEERRFEAERLAQERLAVEEEEARLVAGQLAQEMMPVEEEEVGVEAKRSEQERLLLVENEEAMLEAEQFEQIDQYNGGLNQTSSVFEEEEDDDTGDVYDDEELDDMYDDDDDNDGISNPEPKDVPEQVVEGKSLAVDQISCDNEVTVDAASTQSADEPTPSTGPISDTSFLNVAAAATSTSVHSMFESSRIFEASKTAALFSWYGGGENLGEQRNVSLEEGASNSQPTAEPDSCHEAAEVSDQDNEGINTTSTPLEQVAVAAVMPSLDQQLGSPNMLDNFVKQLERMTESHQLEMDELQRTHKIDIDRLQSELLSERDVKKKAKARDEVASQDKYLRQMRDLEKKFNDILKVKEEELSAVIQRNEGMGLQMDTLKREVAGLARIVDERYALLFLMCILSTFVIAVAITDPISLYRYRDDEICRLKQGHGNTIMQVESGKDEMARKDNEINELRVSSVLHVAFLSH